MEFRLDEGQIELQRTVARFCADRFPLDAVADREGRPVRAEDWQALADLGVLGLLMAEADGGSGLGAVDAALVFEQLGDHLVPGPVLWSLLAAPLVGDVVSGGCMVAGVESSALSDGAVVVDHAAEIDVLLVVHPDRVAAHRLADLPAPVPLDGLDPLAAVGRIHGLGDGETVGDAAAAADLRLLGTVLASAMLVGVSDRSLRVARDYALERHQFGAPIGSFQAIKHVLADVYVRTQCAQSATYAAAAVLDDPGSSDPTRAAAGAKLLAADAAIENATAAIQVLGGMGFTWDMLPNHLLKRAWAIEQDFGTTDDHSAHLGATVAAEAS